MTATDHAIRLTTVGFVVVQGNRANAYSKVIAKWGTYYFKDGQPISEQIWTVNTGQ